ncbi:hypothetical protein V3391_12700 [Luteimonas sp. SMYT11W]|uniref:Uncharacterized protein n=1 Tax=Luteimonas flava TaxID=3115822 RepID=A0ABU7WHS8_9GAMM
MTSDGIYDTQHTVTFTETSLFDRLKEFLPFLPREIPLFAAVTISFWGVAEVLSELGGEAISLRILAAPALATALAVASYKAIQRYKASVPEALLDESMASQAIHRKGRCGWQFALALQMLKERINSSDRMLQRIENGASFVAPKTIDNKEYLDWIKRRPEVLLRLSRSVAIQSTSELPSVLARPRSENFLADLKDSVTQLSKLYQATVTFELEARSIDPPEELTNAHEMTWGWSTPIRDGVREFLDVLEQISQIDPRSARKDGSPPPSFGIKFKPPPNINEFTQELRKHF